MKKTNMKRTILLGTICFILMAASIWYSVAYNDSRFVAPMNLSEYVFRMKDIPMIISGVLFGLYILYAFVLFVIVSRGNRRKAENATTVRNIDPKMGLFGFFGFFGFLGFWTYSGNKEVFPFAFFLFFGFFGLYYEGKMSGTFMDERYKENKMKARLAADKISLSIIFITVMMLGQGSFMGKLEYTLIAIIIIVALAMALNLFLGSYLLYHYDQDDLPDESEE